MSRISRVLSPRFTAQRKGHTQLLCVKARWDERQWPCERTRLIDACSDACIVRVHSLLGIKNVCYAAADAPDPAQSSCRSSSTSLFCACLPFPACVPSLSSDTIGVRTMVALVVIAFLALAGTHCQAAANDYYYKKAKSSSTYYSNLPVDDHLSSASSSDCLCTASSGTQLQD